jgi:phosphate/sulfate permease
MPRQTAASTAQPRTATSLAFLPGLLDVAVAVGVAILRYRLWDIDFIRRMLVYGALTLALGLVYLGCIMLSRTLVAP